MGNEEPDQSDNKTDVRFQGSDEGKLSRILAKTRFYKEVHKQPCWEGFRGLTTVEVSNESQAGAETCS